MTHTYTRRTLLAGGSLMALSLGRLDRALRAVGVEAQLGLQTYSLRSFSFAEALGMIESLGLGFAEPYPAHLTPDAAGDQAPSAKELLKRHRIQLSSFGVVGFDGDVAKSRKVFEFAKAFGIKVLSANPTADSFDSLEDLCAEFSIKIAIHNHGRGHRYAGLADLEKATKGRSAAIGACLDTGHALRTGEVPHQMIRALGPRVHGVHLKDWIADGEEKALGEGDIDLAAVAEALAETGFNGPLSVEYELQPKAPLPGIRAGLTAWEKANR